MAMNLVTDIVSERLLEGCLNKLKAARGLDIAPWERRFLRNLETLVSEGKELMDSQKAKLKELHNRLLCLIPDKSDEDYA